MSSIGFEGGKHTTKQACSGTIPHDFRERENYANSDIDRTRTHLNQHYGCDTAEEARLKLRGRIAECDAIHPPKKNRADRKTSIQMMVYAPREGLDDDERLPMFYEKLYMRFEEFFGKENVIYGTVHYDETHSYFDTDTKQQVESRSHMGVTVVPYTDDMDFVPDKYKAGLNMNNFYRRSLPNMVNKIADEVCEDVFGFPYRDGTGKKSKKTVEQLKEESRAIEEQLAEIDKNKSTIEEQTKSIAENEQTKAKQEKDIELEAERFQASLRQKSDELNREIDAFNEREAEREHYWAEKQAQLELDNKALEAGKKALKSRAKALEREKEAELNRYKEELERQNKAELARQLREQVSDIRSYREWKRNRELEQIDCVADSVSKSGLPRRHKRLDERELPN